MTDNTISTGLEACPLHRKTPYVIKDVSITQLSIARYYGGMTINDEIYTYIYASDELIRNDVLKWKWKQEKTCHAKKPDCPQNMDLGI